MTIVAGEKQQSPGLLRVLQRAFEPELGAAREIADLEAELDRVSKALASRRRHLVTELHDRGHTLRDIGVIVRLSHQRVAQLLAEPTRQRRPA